MSSFDRLKAIVLGASVLGTGLALAESNPASSTPESRVEKVAIAIATRPDAMGIAVAASTDNKFADKFAAHNSNPAGVKQLVKESVSFVNEYVRLANRGGLGISDQEATAFAEQAKKIGNDKASLMQTGGVDLSLLNYNVNAPAVRDAPIATALAAKFTKYQVNGIFALAAAKDSDEAAAFTKAAISHRVAALRAEHGLSPRPLSGDPVAEALVPIVAQEVAVSLREHKAAIAVMTAGVDNVGPKTHLSIPQGATFEASAPELKALENFRSKLVAISADENQIIVTVKSDNLQVANNQGSTLDLARPNVGAGFVRASYK